jgi:hypothetical protein
MDLGHLQWLEANSGRTPSKRDPKGEKPMCSNFITVPRDMWIANSSALRVSNGVADGVSDGVLEYWRAGSRTTNFSQYVYNFRKWPHVGPNWAYWAQNPCARFL